MKAAFVTNLKRQATKILADLLMPKGSTLITGHGQPYVYLVGVHDYELMQRRLELFERLSK